MKVLLLGPYAPHGQVGAIRIISLSRYLVSKGHGLRYLDAHMESTLDYLLLHLYYL